MEIYDFTILLKIYKVSILQIFIAAKQLNMSISHAK